MNRFFWQPIWLSTSALERKLYEKKNEINKNNSKCFLHSSNIVFIELEIFQYLLANERRKQQQQ